MSDYVLQIEDVSKLFRLGTLGSRSLKRDLYQWWHYTLLKKENPFFNGGNEDEHISDHYLWALRNVSFKVGEGEAWGIIGRNGAGKSTLLKILSRISRPTEGQVKGRGKISSLLEIGTGFHAELTGRENIFLSGYMLGMKKQEIKNKFDEIVEFSGVQKFIDTPIKRYSSGMYVRLAFAVAAHLEPDILIVDEVLAVGDADFQQKCLGKMKEVSNKSGRTVLFVSHNMQAITNLCHQAVWLQKGKIRQIGEAATIVHNYTASFKKDEDKQYWDEPEQAPGNDQVRMKSIKISPQTDDPFITVRTPIELEVEFWCLLDKDNINVNVGLYTQNGECVFNLGSPTIKAEKAILALNSVIPGNLLNNTTYTISLTIVRNNSTPIYDFADCLSFEVEDVREGMYYFGSWPGIIRPQIETAFYVKEWVETMG